MGKITFWRDDQRFMENKLKERRADGATTRCLCGWQAPTAMEIPHGFTNIVSLPSGSLENDCIK